MSLSRRTPQYSDDGETRTQRTAPEEVLSLLNAEYTQQLLSEIRTEAKSARALAETCGASRATMYRRLNGLREAGVVDTRLAYDADGHHRTVFESTLESVTFDVTPDGFSVHVTTCPPDSG